MRGPLRGREPPPLLAHDRAVGCFNGATIWRKFAILKKIIKFGWILQNIFNTQNILEKYEIHYQYMT